MAHPAALFRPVNVPGDGKVNAPATCRAGHFLQALPYPPPNAF